MSWFERKLITVLSVILGLLFVAVLLVLSFRYRAAQAAAAENEYTATTEVAETAQSAYTAITYRCDKILLSFALNESGKWYWVSDPSFPLNEETISSISTLVENLTPQQTLLLTEELSAYELDDPVADLTATTPAGTEVKVTIGKATTDGNSRYALLGDGTLLSIIPDTLYRAMQTPIYAMYDLPAFPALTEETLQFVIVQGQKDPENPEAKPLTIFLTALHPEKEGEPTVWRSMNNDVSALPAVTALVEDLLALKVSRCVDYHPSEGALTLCGFDAPAATLTVHYTTASGADGHFTLSVGDREPSGTGRYVQLGEDSTIFLVETALLDPLMSIAANGL